MTIDPARRLEARVPECSARVVSAWCRPDIVVFDPATVRDMPRSASQHSRRPGFPVIVNGVIVVRNADIVVGSVSGRRAVRAPQR